MARNMSLDYQVSGVFGNSCLSICNVKKRLDDFLGETPSGALHKHLIILINFLLLGRAEGAFIEDLLCRVVIHYKN